MGRTYKVEQTINGVTTTVFEFQITVENPDKYTEYEWDSSTGLVTALDENLKRCIIPTSGTTFGKLQPGPFTTTGMLTVKYNYEYY